MSDASPAAATEEATKPAAGDAPPLRVVAVIVTYRRDALLVGTIEAVLGQTRRPDAVLVIDNASAARPALGDRWAGVEIVETGDNLGPAGGYALGFRLALDRGADKVWAVDDDVEPRHDCLERLLAASRGPDVIMPLQVKPAGVRGHPPSWSGPLIDAAVIRGAGVPREDLFFWAEDTEYFWRFREEGFRLRWVDDAVVMHHNPEDRVRGERRDWRLYYEVRNGLYYRLRIRRPTPKFVYRSMALLVGKPVRILLSEPDKLRSLRLWRWGVRDFARGRLGRRVDPRRFPK